MGSTGSAGGGEGRNAIETGSVTELGRGCGEYW